MTIIEQWLTIKEKTKELQDMLSYNTMENEIDQKIMTDIRSGNLRDKCKKCFKEYTDGDYCDNCLDLINKELDLAKNNGK